MTCNFRQNKNLQFFDAYYAQLYFILTDKQKKPEIKVQQFLLAY